MAMAQHGLEHVKGEEKSIVWYELKRRWGYTTVQVTGSIWRGCMCRCAGEDDRQNARG
jgi:hypothetical protein